MLAESFARMCSLHPPPTVKIGNEFPQPQGIDIGRNAADQAPEQVSDADARLAYIAVPRARHRLDLGGLAWSAPTQQTASGRLPVVSGPDRPRTGRWTPIGNA